MPSFLFKYYEMFIFHTRIDDDKQFLLYFRIKITLSSNYYRRVDKLFNQIKNEFKFNFFFFK